MVIKIIYNTSREEIKHYLEDWEGFPAEGEILRAAIKKYIDYIEDDPTAKPKKDDGYLILIGNPSMDNWQEIEMEDVERNKQIPDLDFRIQWTPVWHVNPNGAVMAYEDGLSILRDIIKVSQ